MKYALLTLLVRSSMSSIRKKGALTKRNPADFPQKMNNYRVAFEIGFSLFFQYKIFEFFEGFISSKTFEDILQQMLYLYTHACNKSPKFSNKFCFNLQDNVI